MTERILKGRKKSGNREDMGQRKGEGKRKEEFLKTKYLDYKSMNHKIETSLEGIEHLSKEKTRRK